MFIITASTLMVENPIMKEGIHPHYQHIDVMCSCGHSFQTRSTIEKATLAIEVCSMCHPLYTGKQKIIDTAGRVDKFNKRYGNRAAAKKKTP